jgi:hypothetical protein
MRSRLVTFIAGVALLVPASVGLLTSGVPTLLCPFPALTVVPAFFLDPGFAWAVIVPALLFFAWNPRLFQGSAKIPKRSYALLGVVMVLNVIWFVLGWKYGLEYQGRKFTYSVCAVNLCWATFLGVLFAHQRKGKASFRANLLVHWLLFAWLAWYAFPYLGELP